MPRRTIESAKTFIVNPEGELLALKRGRLTLHRPGSWDLAGGQLKRGETDVEGVVRETRQETGLELEPFEFKHRDAVYGVYRGLLHRGARVRTALFVCTVGTPEQPRPPIVRGLEHSDANWFSPSEFVNLNIPEKYKLAAENIGLIPADASDQRPEFVIPERTLPAPLG